PENSSQAFPSRSRRCTTTGTTASMRKKARWFSLITVVIARMGRDATPCSGERGVRLPTPTGRSHRPAGEELAVRRLLAEPARLGEEEARPCRLRLEPELGELDAPAGGRAALVAVVEKPA